MSRRVQAMLEEQRAFASNASHELRTPLTTIGLRIEALQTDALSSDKHARYLQEVEAEIRRMKDLVDDLILLSRFDTGSVEIGRDIVDIPRLARQLIREMQPQANERSIELALHADDAIPPVRANLTHLHVVFRNILDNAIKYMTESGGTVRWTIQPENGWLVSTIADTGKGIGADELAHVLRRFYRADKSHSRTVPGVGLGLSLVQSIVTAYGGLFTLDSPGPGAGTTVKIAWPTTADTST
jgi:signal transduction histidine kinase